MIPCLFYDHFESSCPFLSLMAIFALSVHTAAHLSSFLPILRAQGLFNMLSSLSQISFNTQHPHRIYFLFIRTFSLVFHLKCFSFSSIRFLLVFISICHVLTRWIRLVATTTWWLSDPSCLTIGSSEESTCPRSSTASALMERAGDSWSKWAFVVWNVPDILVYT